MKSLEEIKIELTLKKLSGELDHNKDIEGLPQDDDLRTFVCSLGPMYAVVYAMRVDKCPHEETRLSASINPFCSILYTMNVDHPIPTPY